MVATPEALLTSVLILLSPLFLALPLSLGWRWWVGTEPEHEHYREKIRRVLDAGIPLRRYRAELDAEARRFLIDPAPSEDAALHPAPEFDRLAGPRFFRCDYRYSPDARTQGYRVGID